MNKYDVIGIIGEGMYGVVLKCKNKISGEFVAIKRFKESNCNDAKSVRKTMIREVKILRMLQHSNCIRLIEAFRRKKTLYLVFEYMEMNLLEYLEKYPTGIDSDRVQSIIYQTCKSVSYCHSLSIIHRDIKPENLLISNKPREQLKLCDFGFSRLLGSPERSENRPLTNYVATRWYRAPELLLRSSDYTPAIDIWAIGCIMGELMTGQPLFPGNDDLDQLYVIQKVLGPLPEKQCEMFSRNPLFVGMKLPITTQVETLESIYVGRCSKIGLSFLKMTLQLDPKQRLTGEQCLAHPYFSSLRQADMEIEASQNQAKRRIMASIPQAPLLLDMNPRPYCDRLVQPTRSRKNPLTKDRHRDIARKTNVDAKISRRRASKKTNSYIPYQDRTSQSIQNLYRTVDEKKSAIQFKKRNHSNNNTNHIMVKRLHQRKTGGMKDIEKECLPQLHLTFKRSTDQMRWKEESTLKNIKLPEMMVSHSEQSDSRLRSKKSRMQGFGLDNFPKTIQSDYIL